MHSTPDSPSSASLRGFRPIEKRDRARPAPCEAEARKRGAPLPTRRNDEAPIDPGMITGCPSPAGQAPLRVTHDPLAALPPVRGRVMLWGRS